MPKSPIQLPLKKIEEFCKKWKVQQLAIFGSVLTPNFRNDSDIDLLYTFSPDSNWGLFEMVGMREELMKIFGRRVDLVSRKAIEKSRNRFRKQAILESAEVIYGKAA